jgi:hypothetical protein
MALKRDHHQLCNSPIRIEQKFAFSELMCYTLTLKIEYTGSMTMSWNVSIVKLSAHQKTLSGIEAYLLPLDAEMGVIDRLSTIFPKLKFETLAAWGTWGYLNGDDYTVQFEIGCEPSTCCKTITLHIRGWNSDGVLNQIIKPLCDAAGWHAFDAHNGTAIDFHCVEPLSGFERWRLSRKQRLDALMPHKSRVVAIGLF